MLLWLMKAIWSSKAGSRWPIIPKWGDQQIGPIPCSGNLMNRPLASGVVAVVGAFRIFLTAAAGDTNSAPVPYTLSSRECFLSGLERSTRQTQKRFAAESILEQTHCPFTTSS